MLLHRKTIGPALACALGAWILALSGCSTTDLPPAPVQAASADYNYVIGAGDKTRAKSELDRIVGKGKSSPAHEEAKKLVAKL